MKNIPRDRSPVAASAALKKKPVVEGPRTQAQAKRYEQQVAERKKAKAKAPRDNTAYDRRAVAKFDKDMSRKATSPPLPYTRPEMKKMKKPKQAMTHQGTRHAKLTSRLQQYVDSLANPWAGTGSRNPINYNPVPTMMTSCATTTNTVTDLIVATLTTTELTLLPGHGQQSALVAMDGVAYHAQLQTIGTAAPTTFTIGPVSILDGQNSITYPPCNGVVTSGLTLGNYAVSSSSVSSSALNQANYDQVLPYSGILANGNHTRWKLVSMGVRIICTTDLDQRGGDVTYVQPSQDVNPFPVSGSAFQVQFADYPSYTVSQSAMLDELKISWIPKPEDCAFWHTTSLAVGSVPQDTANTFLNQVGIRIWFNNSTAFQQTFSFQVVYNWEMGGTNLVTLASPKALQPADKNVIEPMIEVMRFSAKSATTAPSVAKAIVDTISPIAQDVAVAGISQLGKLAGAALLALI